MKKNTILYLGVVLLLAIFLLFSLFINRKESKPQEIQSTTTEVIKTDLRIFQVIIFLLQVRKLLLLRIIKIGEFHITQTKVMYLETFLQIGRKMATIGLLFQNLVSQMEIRTLKSLF